MIQLNKYITNLFTELTCDARSTIYPLFGKEFQFQSMTTG